ncbi:MAG TPA: glycosyltransferase family 4 protein [Burkholderiaceae bacterium]|nr:glycosyltransferase family 4 protein [Burkholderiaceae bacterium]
MRKPKVVILSPPLTAVSGFSTHANLLLASGLSQTYELLHFCAGSEGRVENRLQKLARLVSSPFALLRFGLRQRPDIVHINTGLDHKAYWRDLSYLAMAKLLRIKVVNQIHGGPTPAQFFPHSAALTWLLRRVLESSDAVSVLSREEYKAYAAFAPDILLARIPNAIDPSDLLGPIAAPEPGRPLRLVYIGRLVREKGLFEALDAIASLRRAGRRLQLDIAGGGAARQELQARSAELGLSDSVTFHGPVFGAEKNALWRAADALVFPSYSEGLPYSLLEAMAAGTPAITCAVGAVPDVMQHGVHGLFVPPRDADAVAAAIAALDDDRALLERMAHAARDRVLEHYTLNRLAQDFGNLYEAVLRHKK